MLSKRYFLLYSLAVAEGCVKRFMSQLSRREATLCCCT